MLAKKLVVIILVAMLISMLPAANCVYAQTYDTREAELRLVGRWEAVKPEVTIQSHFFPFIPSCVFPTHTMAVAVFTTGPGPVQVQFHGTNVWSSSSVCPYESCGWEAYADMSTGDEIWLYSVTAGISNHVSNWCGSIAK